MRFYVVCTSQAFIDIFRRTFRATPATATSHWVVVKNKAGNLRRQFPPTTILVFTAPGPPQIFFDGVGHTITTPPGSAYESFALALTLLHALAETRVVDMVAILPFGPCTPRTVQEMHAAYSHRVY